MVTETGDVTKSTAIDGDETSTTVGVESVTSTTIGSAAMLAERTTGSAMTVISALVKDIRDSVCVARHHGPRVYA